MRSPPARGPPAGRRGLCAGGRNGNLLVYRADTLRQDEAELNDLGGISRQYLNHRHEAAPACDWVAETFAAPLFCHESDAESASAGCNVDETFSARHRLDDDFEVIPTPGHTSGATAYLWDTGEHRCLFTGDTLFFPAASGGRCCSALTRRRRSTGPATGSNTSRASS